MNSTSKTNVNMLSSALNIKKLFKEYEARPLKQLGQNFLINKKTIKKIVDTADIQTNDTILEVGPGIGVLTQEIASKTKRVIAVEKDPKMLEILKQTLKDFKNIKIYKKDILKFDLSVLPKSYKVVANIPFYLTVPLIRKFLEHKSPPKEIILVIQKEVAQRICAKPERMNILAISVQIYAKPKKISYISKKSFWPQPKIDSAILKIIPLKTNQEKIFSMKLFFQIVKAGFAHPRKQILNNLQILGQNQNKKSDQNKKEIKAWLIENKIKPTLRAEKLTIQDWINLENTYSSIA